MTPNEFTRWAEHHAVLFCMNRPEDVALIRAWWPSLATFAEADCHEATRSIAENDPPRFREQHLSRLLDSLRTLEYRRREDERESQIILDMRCRTCSGTGGVIVPHIRYVLDGTWERSGRAWLTMLAFCRCQRGVERRMSADAYLATKHPNRGLSGWSIDSYELRVPHWQKLMQDRENALMAETAALDYAGRLDKKLGALTVEGIRQRLNKLALELKA